MPLNEVTHLSGAATADALNAEEISSSRNKSATGDRWPDPVALRPFMASLVADRISDISQVFSRLEILESRWERLAQWLIDQEMAALAWKQIASVPAAEPLRALLQPQAYHDLGAALLARQQLVELAGHLNQAGVEFVVLKGAALAPTVYPEPELRSMADIDLLVRPGDIPGIIEMLSALGYTETIAPEMQPGLELRAGRHYPRLLADDPNRVGIELHQTLAPADESWIQPDAGWFWERTTTISLDGIPMRILRPPANLLHLAMHLVVEHGLSQAILKWLADIHFLITNTPAFFVSTGYWEEVVAGARHLGWSAAVVEALDATRTWFGTAVPDDVIRRLSQDSDPRLQRMIASRSRQGRSKTENALLHILSLRGARRWKTLIAILIPSPDYMRWRYQPSPPWLWPLYYPLRWSYMILETLKTATGRLARRIRLRA